METSQQAAVAIAFDCGFLSGRRDESFDGSAHLTRSEAAVLLSVLVKTSMFSTQLQGVSSEGQPPEISE